MISACGRVFERDKALFYIVFLGIGGRSKG